MFINKGRDGKNNVSGARIAGIRAGKTPVLSQRAFADALQRRGLDVDKNVVQRIESGKRFVTDIELAVIAKVLGIQMEALIDDQQLPAEE